MLALLLAGVLASSPSPQSAPAQDIHRVDFQNFAYTPWCTQETLTTKNGVFERQNGDDRIFFKVMQVSYGDVTGDGRDEALVVTVCNTGGSGYFSDAFVFGLEAGRPKLLAKQGGGDRADGGFGDIFADRGAILIDRYVNNGSGACCADFVDRIEFRLAGGALKEQRRVSRTRVIEDDGLDGSRPLVFKPGASSATINAATLTRVTYRLSARQGQTMTVRVESRRTPTVTVIDPAGHELGTIDPGREWRGALPATGAYSLRVASQMYVTLFRLIVEIK